MECENKANCGLVLAKALNLGGEALNNPIQQLLHCQVQK